MKMKILLVAVILYTSYDSENSVDSAGLTDNWLLKWPNDRTAVPVNRTVFTFPIHLSSSSCSFPSALSGTWENPSKGNLTFNDTHLSGYDVDVYTDLDFECHIKEGKNYVLRSSDFTLLGVSNVVNAVFCVELQQISKSKFVYFVLTTELEDANNERVMFIQSSATISSADEICNDTSVSQIAQETKLLIKYGDAMSETVTCPNHILGTYWYYNHTTCTESYWDVCSTTSQMTFNYTMCSETQAFSTNGSVRCVYNTKSGGDSITYVYNEDQTVDNSASYQYSCMVLKKENSGLVYVTQHPQDCYKNQTSTWVPAAGQSIILSPNVTCVPSSPSVANAGLIAGLVILFVILLGAGGAVVGYYIYTKKFKKVDPHEKQIIDRESTVVSTDNRQTDAVTPSVVKADVTSPRNGGSHGKISHILGPEYTMTNACDDDKAEGTCEIPDVTDLDKDSPRKLPAISTGNTPREALSPLDTQLKKPQLPPIP